MNHNNYYIWKYKWFHPTTQTFTTQSSIRQTWEGHGGQNYSLAFGDQDCMDKHMNSSCSLAKEVHWSPIPMSMVALVYIMESILHEGIGDRDEACCGLGEWELLYQAFSLEG